MQINKNVLNKEKECMFARTCEASTACFISNQPPLLPSFSCPVSSLLLPRCHSFTPVRREPLRPYACAEILLRNHSYSWKKNKSNVLSDCIRAAVWWFVWVDNNHSPPAIHWFDWKLPRLFICLFHPRAGLNVNQLAGTCSQALFDFYKARKSLSRICAGSVCAEKKNWKRKKGGGELVSVKQLDLFPALVKASESNQNEQEEAERALKSVFSPWQDYSLCVMVVHVHAPLSMSTPPPSPLKTVRCSFCKRWDWLPDRLSGSFTLVAISWQYPYMRRGWIEVLSSGHSSNRVAWWPWKSIVNAHGAAKMKFNSRWWKTVPTSAVKLSGPFIF